MADPPGTRHCQGVHLLLDDIDALASDGTVVHIRPVHITDRASLHAVVDRCSEQSVYLRFFSANRTSAHDYVDTLFERTEPALSTDVVQWGDQVVGFASSVRVSADRAEAAVLVDDAHQHRGVGTLLFEHLAAEARAAGLGELVVDVLAQNATMLRLLHDLGYPIQKVRSGTDEHLVWDLTPGPAVRANSAERDQIATAHSLRPLLAPTSIAVVGATERERSVGRAVFERLITGFTGRTYAVNPRHDSVLGRPCHASVADLPEAPDLAIIAVPAGSVVEAARECGERGVRGLVVLGAGFREAGADGAALESALLATARDHGMRLLGPNCLGILNTDPAVRLSASLAALSSRSGSIGLAAQSGALGIAAVADLDRHEAGVSQFVSLGNKADVSGNDLLRWWAADPQTSVIGLYLESFGNQDRFRRIAREVTRHKPVVAIKAGRSVAGLRAGSSHTAAAASPDDLVDALCAQSGVARVDTLEELVAALRVLSSQSLPSGPRLAIIGNSGGPEILAADYAETTGLIVPVLTPPVAAALAAVAPLAAAVGNPIDLGAAMTQDHLTRALALVLGCVEVDAVAVVACETGAISAAEIAAALRTVASCGKPVVVTVLGPDRVEQSGVPPIFDYPEVAVSALATAWRCARLRTETATPPSRTAARAPSRPLAGQPDGWLSGPDAVALVSEYGIPTVPHRIVADADDAVEIAAALGYPVVAKAEGIVHKVDVGGVRLGLRDADEVRTAVRELLALAPSVALQPTADSTFELLIGAVRVPQFGAAVVLAAGGVNTDLVADRVLRLAPLADNDAEQMADSLRCHAVFDGFRGAVPISRARVCELLLAVSRLMDEQPRIAELDLNPIRCAGDQLVAVDVKVRLAEPGPYADPLLRALNPRRSAPPDTASS